MFSGEVKLFWVAYTDFGGLQTEILYQLLVVYLPFPPKM